MKKCVKEYVTALSIFFSTVLGGHLANNYQSNFWKSKQTYSINIRKLNEMKESLDDLIILMLDRSYKLKVVHWETLRLHNKIASGKGKKRDLKNIIDGDKYKDYMLSVKKWNVHLIQVATEIKFFFSYEISKNLYTDIHSPEKSIKDNNIDKKTIHGLFIKAHKSIIDLINCKSKECNQETYKKASNDDINRLGISISKFISDFYQDYSDRKDELLTDFQKR